MSVQQSKGDSVRPIFIGLMIWAIAVAGLTYFIGEMGTQPEPAIVHQFQPIKELVCYEVIYNGKQYKGCYPAGEVDTTQSFKNIIKQLEALGAVQSM